MLLLLLLLLKPGSPRFLGGDKRHRTSAVNEMTCQAGGTRGTPAAQGALAVYIFADTAAAAAVVAVGLVVGAGKGAGGLLKVPNLKDRRRQQCAERLRKAVGSRVGPWLGVTRQMGGRSPKHWLVPVGARSWSARHRRRHRHRSGLAVMP